MEKLYVVWVSVEKKRRIETTGSQHVQIENITEYIILTEKEWLTLYH